MEAETKHTTCPKPTDASVYCSSPRIDVSKPFADHRVSLKLSSQFPLLAHCATVWW